MLIFKAKKDKLRKRAKELLDLGKKIQAYRFDLWDDATQAEYGQALERLQMALEDHNDAHQEALQKPLEALKTLMKVHGGHFYPRRVLPENIEVFLVAAILALGVRTFFLQPFAIPTNSMFPTYNGMTFETYGPKDKAPGSFERIFRKIVYGASRYELLASDSGTLKIPLASTGGDLFSIQGIRFQAVTGTRMLFIPTPNRKYTLYVGNNPVTVTLPWDFPFESVLAQTYFGKEGSFEQFFGKGKLSIEGKNILLDTGIPIKRGEFLAHFDLLAGDMLFVDRLSYHFRDPKIGEPIVFRTDRIKGLSNPDGSPEEKYFIKRLVGKAGDVLEIKPPLLYRNHLPIEGAPAFAKNARKEGLYKGYQAAYRLAPGKQETVEPGYIYAMGDNSYNSGDSRVWGGAPEKDLIGKAVFVFYPWTHRFGVAR